LFQCSDDDFNYQEYISNDYKTYSCGSTVAGLVFFLTFNLFVPLIFLDLFIAIILEGFEQMSKNVNVIISEDDLEKFRDCWAEFDKDVSSSNNITIKFRVRVSSRSKICLSSC
jgi:hypothetical protein